MPTREAPGSIPLQFDEPFIRRHCEPRSGAAIQAIAQK